MSNSCWASKLGVAFDQGFGLAVEFSPLHGFIGNDGVSIDYLLLEEAFNTDIPLTWYVGAGGYYNWSGRDNIGVRVPLGITLPFAKSWDIYGQISPAVDYNLDKEDIKFKLDAAIGIRYEF